MVIRKIGLSLILTILALNWGVLDQVNASSLIMHSSADAVGVGESVRVSIIVDTDGQAVLGAGAIILYDASLLEIGNLRVVEGVFDDYPAAIVDTDRERIQISGISASADNPFSGAGLLASFDVIGLQKGNAKLELMHSPGSTIDSNVTAIENGEAVDTLTDVKHLNFTIVGSESGTGGVSNNQYEEDDIQEKSSSADSSGGLGGVASNIQSFLGGDNTSNIDKVGPIPSQEPKTSLNNNVARVLTTSPDDEGVIEDTRSDKDRNLMIGVVMFIVLVILISIAIAVVYYRKKSQKVSQTTEESPINNPPVEQGGSDDVI